MCFLKMMLIFLDLKTFDIFIEKNNTSKMQYSSTKTSDSKFFCRETETGFNLTLLRVGKRYIREKYELL